MKKFYLIAAMVLMTLAASAQQTLNISTYNGTNLARYDGQEYNVVVNRYMFTGWNTIALPFSVTEDELNEAFGSDCQLEKLVAVEANGNTNDEVIQAASSLIGANVDAVFTPTDNVIMAAELAIAPMFAEAGIPHFTGADIFVRNGALTTCGVNYTDLGTKTADLAFEAMTKGMADMEDYYLMDGGIVTVNTETAEALGFNYDVLRDFGELVEVVTTED